MSADRYEITDADHGAIRISHPSAHLPHEFVCIHPGADPWSAFSNGVIRQQARDIALLTQMLHDQRLVIDDLEHRRVKVCDENDQLRTDLAAAVAERDAKSHALAAERSDYDRAVTRVEQAEARLARNTCEHCDGTGDVHTPTGEWVGECDCVYAQNNKLRAFKSAVEAAPVVACVSYVDAWKVFVRIPNAPMPPIGTELIARPAKD